MRTQMIINPESLTVHELLREAEDYMNKNDTPDIFKAIYVRLSTFHVEHDQAVEESDIDKALKNTAQLENECLKIIIRDVHQWAQHSQNQEWFQYWLAEVPRIIGITHQQVDALAYVDERINKQAQNLYDEKMKHFNGEMDQLNAQLKDCINKLSFALNRQSHLHNNVNFEDDIPF